MLARTGRPRISDKRDYQLIVRMNSEEKAILEEICRITGREKNYIIRKLLEEYYEKLINTERTTW